jgi:hypothetical protein
VYYDRSKSKIQKPIGLANCIILLKKNALSHTAKQRVRTTVYKRSVTGSAIAKDRIEQLAGSYRKWRRRVDSHRDSSQEVESVRKELGITSLYATVWNCWAPKSMLASQSAVDGVAVTC